MPNRKNKEEKVEIDRDTRKVISDGEKMKSTVESAGWGILRNLLLKRAADYYSIGNIDVQQTPAGNLVQVIVARKMVADELMQWLREVESSVEQYKGNVPIFEDLIQEHILRV